MPIKTVAYLCRGCGAIFRTIEEALQHETGCPEIAMEKRRLHDLTRSEHKVQAVLKPNPTAILKKKA